MGWDGSYYLYDAFYNNSPCLNAGEGGQHIGVSQSPTIVPTSSTTYYVAKTGDDSDGLTWATAWDAISDAAAVAVAGDTVLVGAGTYSGSVTIENGGSDGLTLTYEAQGAIWLEAQVDENETGSYAFDLLEPDDPQAPWLIDPAAILRAVRDDMRAGVKTPIIAARFHHGVADMIRDLCVIARQTTGITSVVLSGGVFQNATLFQQTIPRLEDLGMTVYRHRLVPPNDGGLALGQAAIAAYQILHGED